MHQEVARGKLTPPPPSLQVTPIESNNYYHYFDNRVLPSHVDEALATKEGESAAGGKLPTRLDTRLPTSSGRQHRPAPTPFCFPPSPPKRPFVTPLLITGPALHTT